VFSAYDVIKLKGYTSWAIGQTIATICHAVCCNERNIYPLSAMVKVTIGARVFTLFHVHKIWNEFSRVTVLSAQGFHGITDEVYLSLPCVLGEEGITHIINQTLTASERSKVQESAKMLRGIITGVQL
jgi:L-lactate dehydrogenase